MLEKYKIEKRLQRWINALEYRLGGGRFNPDDFKLVLLEVEIPGLDPIFSGYRIAHLTDLHLGQWITADRLRGIVDLINQREPDLVAITGDFVSYGADAISPEMVASLKRLAPRETVLAVLGNHDHWSGAGPVRKVLSEVGILELANRHYEVRRGSANLLVAGVDDILTEHDQLSLVIAMMPAAVPSLLLAHEPDFADTSAASGRFALQLSGHSHGGQIVLPKLGPIYRGPMFQKYPLGCYQVAGMALYTSPGVGTNLFRLRINCPPEITFFTLRPAHAGGYPLIRENS